MCNLYVKGKSCDQDQAQYMKQQSGLSYLQSGALYQYCSISDIQYLFPISYLIQYVIRWLLTSSGQNMTQHVQRDSNVDNIGSKNQRQGVMGQFSCSYQSSNCRDLNAYYKMVKSSMEPKNMTVISWASVFCTIEFVENCPQNSQDC